MKHHTSFLRARASAISALLSVFLVSGCASSTADRYQAVVQKATTAGFSPVRYGLAPPVIGMLRTANNSHIASHKEAQILWVMIEGDGRAWLNTHEPSFDPTPVDAAGWRLAQNIARENVLYLARPCQYLSSTELDACSVSDWTHARFSEKWVGRLSAAIDDAKRSTHSGKIVIAGYSGGGVMAVLLAARRDDVVMLITVASPLDHTAWTTHHGVSPLTDSLNALSIREKIMRLTQVHVTGADDKVVPTILLQNFLRAYPVDAPVELVTLPEVDHRMRIAIDLSRIKSASLLSRSVDDQDIYP